MAPDKATKPTLRDLVLNHANAHADLGNKKKADAYRRLMDEAEMPSMKAIAKHIAKDGISESEQLILNLAAIAVSAD